MAVKYECPECGRRFLEWGAEKNGFKCPNDENCPEGHPEDIELTAIKFEQDQPIRRKPTLKRTAAAAKRRRATEKVDPDKASSKSDSGDTKAKAKAKTKAKAKAKSKTKSKSKSKAKAKTKKK